MGDQTYILKGVQRNKMKKYVTYFLLFSGTFWILDSFVDYLLISSYEFTLLFISQHDMIFRLLTVFMLFVCCSVFYFKHRGDEMLRNQLKQSASDLNERVKELHCISEISKIIQEGDDFLPDIFSKVVDVIPEAFMRPKDTCCCINYDSTFFKANCSFVNPKDCAHAKKHKIVKKLEEDIALKIQLKNSHNFISEEYTLVDVIEGRLNKSIERIATNRTLKENEQFLNSLIDQNPFAIWISDTNGLFIRGNPALYKILNLTEEQLVGKYNVFDDPQLEQHGLKGIIQDVLGGNVRDFDFTWTGAKTTIDGLKESNIVVCDGTAFPIKDTKGNITNALVIYRDATKQKEIEDALKRSEEKLNRSKKMEAIGLMAGGVAHDLNNVLSGMVTTPELLLMKLDKDDPIVKYVKIIMQSGERATAIVSELLTIARGIISKKVSLNLNDIVNEYLQSGEYVKTFRFHPDVKIVNNLADDLLPINCSKIHIYKLLLNLVSNAMESIDGKGTVTITSDNVYLDAPLIGYDDVSIGEYVYLQIKDSGIGMTKADIQHIFEPFYTKKQMGRSGTGLGLSVVWNVIQDHKGYINVKSSEEGTIFEIYFPVTRRPIEDITTEEDVANCKSNGETILIIDDSKEQIEITSYMLHHFGYETKGVESGEEGVEYLKNNHVDLVVLDMIMPGGMNGYETYLVLKKVKPDIKVILASGHAETILINKALKAGVIDYLKKPYRVSEICKIIALILKGEK